MIRTKTINPIIGRIRSQSFILNPANRNAKNGFFNESSPADLKTQIMLIQGGEKEKGQFWDKERSRFEIAYLPSRQKDLKAVESEYKNYCQMQLNSGNRAPENWPDHLLVKKQEAEARIQIHEEELTWLRGKLEAAVKEAEALKPATEGGLYSDRSMWGIAKMRDGVLSHVAGQTCSLNSEGLLEISDAKSPFNSLPVWRFKAEICNPMHSEYSYRCRQEDKAALKENRPKKAVAFPPAPKYDKKTDTIIYTGYSENTLSKLQTS